MTIKLPTRRPKLPLALQRLSNDEYTPLPYDAVTLRAVGKVQAQGPRSSKRLAMSLGDYWSSRLGTAAALRAVDDEFGGGFYNVPEEATLDREAADAALGGDQFIVDVQTHYVAERQANEVWAGILLGNAESVSADRFKGLDELMYVQEPIGYSFAEYLRCVFLESETSIAILTSGPGADGRTPTRMLHNQEMIGTRDLIERLGGTGRLINHSVVHPRAPLEIETMDRWADWCKPAGWKVYTMFGVEGRTDETWMMDDDETGEPFLDRVMETGVKTISAHKGLSYTPSGVDVGWEGSSSPKDVGPVAKAYPEINFIIFHSGYEARVGDEEEGPYVEQPSPQGTDRLVKSLKDAGVGPGGNVYAELGTTWYMVMPHPREAAHVLGKLLVALGEDNIVWGTDSIWYGPAQPLIDAFRAYEIPEEYCERYGYPRLTVSGFARVPARRPPAQHTLAKLGQKRPPHGQGVRRDSPGRGQGGFQPRLRRRRGSRHYPGVRRQGRGKCGATLFPGWASFPHVAGGARGRRYRLARRSRAPGAARTWTRRRGLGAPGQPGAAWRLGGRRIGGGPD